MRGRRLFPFMLLCTPLLGQLIRLEDRAGIARDSADRATREAALTGTTFFFAAESFPALARRGVRVPEAKYVLWAWAREDAPVSIFLGDDEYYAEAAEKDAENPRFLWRTVGTASFSRGTITVKAEKGAASVAALCLTQGADIKKLWPAMWARPEEPAPVPDSRASTCRHINQAYETWTFPSREAWLKRATHLRRHLRAACGLWPPPRKTRLNARIFDRIERDTYSVEKVHFEPWPGFYTTGNLYRPRGKTGPFPAVLCPHGHWGNGRFTDNGEPQGCS